MTVTNEDLNQFHEFAKVVIARSDDKLTLDELWDQWRLENPTQAEFEENVLAVKSAIRDMEAGDRGMPVEEHVREVRKKYNLPGGS
jgi:hypothetical protein